MTRRKTPTPQDPRTKAQLLELLGQQAETREHWERRASDVANELQAERLAQDHEARAISTCITAVETMLQRQREDRSRNSSGAYQSMATASYIGGERARLEPVLEQPIGRLLMFLAYRYAVPLQPIPQPVSMPVTDQPMVMVELPQDLANQAISIMHDRRL